MLVKSYVCFNGANCAPLIQLHFLGVLLVLGFAAQVFELVQRRLFAAQIL